MQVQANEVVSGSSIVIESFLKVIVHVQLILRVSNLV
jgi:hypothetical protein